MARPFAPLWLIALLSALLPRAGAVERYVIDTAEQHAFIQFRVPHLGFSWLYGRFNDFDGRFTFDPEQPGASSVQVEIRTASIDSNHELRDTHLRGEDFLASSDYPLARFESTAFVPLDAGQYRLEGTLELMGRQAPIVIEVEQIGAGTDPWGGFRRGFEGRTSLTLREWGIDYELPGAEAVELTLSIEGIRLE